MSGIAAIVTATGEPDRATLEAMVDAMAGRGPDARGTLFDGGAGLGCAHLRSTPESTGETLPIGLGNGTSIVGDLRIDDRARLRRELEREGRRPAAEASDATLVLEAWAAWGESCVDHLLGDFVFAIWDRRAGTLFAARDHWGIKPLFMAVTAKGGLALASDLEAIRLHPDVSDRLDERAITDFLMFGHFLDMDMTPYSSVRRVPAAHALLWRDGQTRLRQYWELPVEEPFHGGRTADYAQRLLELLRVAVDDRMRTNRVGVRMSGGLDSPALAAVARGVLEVGSDEYQLHAFTSVFESLIPDDEADFAQQVADWLDIPIHFHVEDRFPPLGGGRPPARAEPEPEDSLHTGSERAMLVRVRDQGIRVLLSGIGGDETTRAPRSYAAWILQHRALGRLLADVGLHLVHHRRLPGLGIRTGLRDRRRKNMETWPFPRSLRPEVVARLGLHDRWRQAHVAELLHPIHPESYRMLTAPLFSQTLEATDPGRRGMPVEHRYPFLDLRLVRFLLRLPVRYSWSMRKGLLREALRGVLPESVRMRPKTPLAGDLLGAWLGRSDRGWLPEKFRSERLADFVRPESFPGLAPGGDFRVEWSSFRVISLDRWLYSHELGEPSEGESE